MSILFADDRSVEEALGLDRFDPAKHPRGRGGQFAEILGRVAALHKSLGGHPGVQNRLDRGQLNDDDAKRIKSFARKNISTHGVQAMELSRLVDMAQSPQTRRAPGGERHASVLFAPSTGGGGGLAPGLGDTHLQPDELRSERYRRSKKAGMFAPHRGGGSGLVPGGGVARMQPDERRAATRSPGGERSAATERLQQRAVDRSREIHNQRVAREESLPEKDDLKNLSDAEIKRLASHMMAGHMDDQPEHKREALAKEANKRAARRRSEGVFYRERKPGSKMSRRTGHDLLTEAVVEAVRREFGK